MKFIKLYMGIIRLRDKCFATRNIVELMIKENGKRELQILKSIERHYKCRSAGEKWKGGITNFIAFRVELQIPLSKGIDD